MINQLVLSASGNASSSTTFGDYIHGVNNFYESNVLWPFTAVCFQFDIQYYIINRLQLRIDIN